MTTIGVNFTNDKCPECKGPLKTIQYESSSGIIVTIVKCEDCLYKVITENENRV